MAINISFTADPLAPDFTGSLQDFQDRFLLNLQGKISETQVLIGQVGGTKPTSNIGPWLNNDTWYIWNGSEYVPTTVKVGGTGYVVQLLGIASASGIPGANAISTGFLPDRTQILQDKDGTIALLSDVYQGRAAITLSGTTPTIDWNLGHHFVETLTGNTTVKMINSQDGQSIIVAFRNNATSFTVTWPSFIYWAGGSAPVQTASKTDLYIFYNIAGSIFGRVVANY